MPCGKSTILSLFMSSKFTFLKFTPLQVLEKDTVINNDKKGDQFSITGDSNSQTNANKCSC